MPVIFLTAKAGAEDEEQGHGQEHRHEAEGRAQVGLGRDQQRQEADRRAGRFPSTRLLYDPLTTVTEGGRTTRQLFPGRTLMGLACR